MKKWIKIFLYSAVMLSIGFGVGFVYVSIQEGIRGKYIEEQEQELLARIDEYRLSCRELTNKSVPVLKKIGRDYLAVFPRPEKGDYIVVGINMEDRPMVSWSGSDLQYRIKQTCHPEHK